MEKSKRRGLFVTFEGGEGSGKTTLISHLYDYLISKGRDVIKTQEPGATQLGAHIRSIILKRYDLTKRTELLLYLADRAQHVEEVILPALKKCHIVLCDRFNDSTLAYQGGGRGLERDMLHTLCSFSADNLIPDLTIFLKLDPEVGLLRAKRSGTPDRLEEEELSFHQRVQRTFISLAKRELHRFYVIDATQQFDHILEMAIQKIEPLLCSI